MINSIIYININFKNDKDDIYNNMKRNNTKIC